jgi:glycosyltransferase involved in cell wall biosynthesis
MINNKKVVAVLPAYNAEKTLQRTVDEIPGSVDTTILVDDHSTDETATLAQRLGLQVHVHEPAPISWSCCIPITSTRPCWWSQWRA